jgi:hypothetical protein
VARTKQTSIDTVTKLQEEAKGYALTVNEGNTKYTKCGRRKTYENKLEIKPMEFRFSS